MSEVHSRTPLGASRGRGSSRGGRGGSSAGGRGALTNRGARGSANGASDSIGEDQGEVGQLLKQYATELAQLKEMFPDWTSEDIVFALDENQGDVQITVEKISEGSCLPPHTIIHHHHKHSSKQRVFHPGTSIVFAAETHLQRYALLSRVQRAIADTPLF